METEKKEKLTRAEAIKRLEKVREHIFKGEDYVAISENTKFISDFRKREKSEDCRGYFFCCACDAHKAFVDGNMKGAFAILDHFLQN